MSRALGDLGFKDRIDLKAEEQAVTSFPDVTSRPRHESDSFLVIACDGIWDCLSNQQCVDKLTLKMKQNGDSGMVKCIEETFDEILAKCITADGKGTDNMTAILISFNDKTK